MGCGAGKGTGGCSTASAKSTEKEFTHGALIPGEAAVHTASYSLSLCTSMDIQCHAFPCCEVLHGFGHPWLQLLTTCHAFNL